MILKLMSVCVVLLCGGSAAAADDIFMRHGDGDTVVLSNLPDSDDFELLLAAPKLAVPLDVAKADASPGESPSANLRARATQYRDLIADAAKIAKVEARLVHAVIAVESGYNPRAVSPKGALGLMQVMPETARRYGIADARDPVKNLEAGARYLGDLLKLFNNDLHLALAAYNAGEKAVLRYGSKIPPFRETEAYVPKVLGVYRRLETLPI